MDGINDIDIEILALMRKIIVVEQLDKESISVIPNYDINLKLKELNTQMDMLIFYDIMISYRMKMFPLCKHALLYSHPNL